MEAWPTLLDSITSASKAPDGKGRSCPKYALNVKTWYCYLRSTKHFPIKKRECLDDFLISMDPSISRNVHAPSMVYSPWYPQPPVGPPCVRQRHPTSQLRGGELPREILRGSAAADGRAGARSRRHDRGAKNLWGDGGFGTDCEKNLKLGLDYFLR